MPLFEVIYAHGLMPRTIVQHWACYFKVNPDDLIAELMSSDFSSRVSPSREILAPPTPYQLTQQPRNHSKFVLAAKEP